MRLKKVFFKTAELLKEVGFDIETYSDCWVKTLDGDIIHNSERRDCAEHDRCKHYLMEPTLALVKMWFEIKHNINLYTTFNSHYQCWYCKGVRFPHGIISIVNTEGYNSSDEALEQGIIEACKILKVK